MTDPDLAPDGPTTAQHCAAGASTITAVRDNLVTGTDFLPDHIVVVRVTYAADDVSDYLSYRANASGDLYAELPTSPGSGPLHVTATDYRTDSHGACGVLWSNTEVRRT
jgi:hypothetical protein